MSITAFSDLPQAPLVDQKGKLTEPWAALLRQILRGMNALGGVPPTPTSTPVLATAYKGQWNGTTTYFPGDEVSNAGNVYRCLIESLNVTPVNGSNWLLIGPLTADYLADGSTRAITNATALTSGNVDLAKSGVVGKSLANVTDDAGSSRYAVINGGSLKGVSSVDPNKLALIDFSQSGHTGKSLANIPDDAGSTRYAVASIDANRKALIDFSQSGHTNLSTIQSAALLTTKSVPITANNTVLWSSMNKGDGAIQVPGVFVWDVFVPTGGNSIVDTVIGNGLDANGYPNGYLFRVALGGQFNSVYHTASNAFTLLANTTNNTPAGWHRCHVVIKSNPQTFDFYVDGVLQCSVADSTTIMVTGNGAAWRYVNVTGAIATPPNYYRMTTPPAASASATTSMSQSSTTTTINVGAGTYYLGDRTVSANSGSVNPGSYGTYYVYFDDPLLVGGAVTYQATTSQVAASQGYGRVYVGQITTASGGGGTGGGTLGCFSGDTRVMTADGWKRFDELPQEFEIVNRAGRFRATLLVHPDNTEPLRRMGAHFVTEEHRFRVGGEWVPAKDLFHEPVIMGPRTVYNMEVQTDSWDDKHYLLENGLTAHNPKP